MYNNPYVTQQPYKPLNWGSQNIYAPGQFSAQAGLERFNSTLPTPDETPKTDMTGAYVGAGTAALGLVTDAVSMGNQSLGIETSAPGLQRSATGEPVYNTGGFMNQASLAKPQGSTVGEVGAGVAKGASAGAAFGVPGAIVGGFIGGITSAFGGRRRKRKQEAEKKRALKSARLAQGNYNVASEAFDEKEAAQSDYMKRMDNTNRMFNLYRSNY